MSSIEVVSHTYDDSKGNEFTTPARRPMRVPRAPRAPRAPVKHRYVQYDSLFKTPDAWYTFTCAQEMAETVLVQAMDRNSITDTSDTSNVHVKLFKVLTQFPLLSNEESVCDVPDIDTLYGVKRMRVVFQETARELITRFVCTVDGCLKASYFECVPYEFLSKKISVSSTFCDKTFVHHRAWTSIVSQLEIMLENFIEKHHKKLKPFFLKSLGELVFDMTDARYTIDGKESVFAILMRQQSELIHIQSTKSFHRAHQAIETSVDETYHTLV